MLLVSEVPLYGARPFSEIRGGMLQAADCWRVSSSIIDLGTVPLSSRTRKRTKLLRPTPADEAPSGKATRYTIESDLELFFHLDWKWSRYPSPSLLLLSLESSDTKVYEP